MAQLMNWRNFNCLRCSPEEWMKKIGVGLIAFHALYAYWSIGNKQKAVRKNGECTLYITQNSWWSVCYLEKISLELLKISCGHIRSMVTRENWLTIMRRRNQKWLLPRSSHLSRGYIVRHIFNANCSFGSGTNVIGVHSSDWTTFGVATSEEFECICIVKFSSVSVIDQCSSQLAP